MKQKLFPQQFFSKLKRLRAPALLLILTSTLGASCINDVSKTSTLKERDEIVVSSLFAEDGVERFNSAFGRGFSKVTLNLGEDFRAENICSGKTILGKEGLAFCDGCPYDLNSNTYRIRGSTTLRLGSNETVFDYSGVRFPSNFNEVPNPITDDHGACGNDACISTNLSGSKAIPREAHAAFAICGTTQSTVEARIADCVSKNGLTWTTWRGVQYGNQGEGDWKLVSVAENKGFPPFSEVWRDERTRLLWSSKTRGRLEGEAFGGGVVATGKIWCAAAGNDSTGAGECGNGTNHNIVSYCFEGPLRPNATATPEPGIKFPGDSWNYTTSTFTYDPAKGKMGKHSTPSVIWRLPHLRDYQQAIVNGIASVMPDMIADDETFGNSLVSEITASPNISASTDRTSITDRVYYVDAMGRVATYTPTDKHTFVRCVGRY